MSRCCSTAKNDSLRHILYVKGGESPFPLHLYDTEKGKSEQIVHAKVLPAINRIPDNKGAFRVWCDGSVEFNIEAGDVE